MTKRLVLAIVGGQFHPFAECGAILKEFVEAVGRYDVTVTEDWDMLRRNTVCRYDAVIAYTQGGAPTSEQLDGLLGRIREGGAFVGLHGASATWKECATYHDMLGCTFAGHGPVSEFTVTISDTQSEITRGVDTFHIEDELYRLGAFDASHAQAVATVELEGETQPVAYTKTYGAGKVFYLSLGHDQRAFNHPQFRKLVIGGLDWTVSGATPQDG